jgi:hypothetical protein
VKVKEEKTWRCDCGDDHFLSVFRWSDDPEGCLALTDGTHCQSLWCRLRAAWNVVLHGRGFGHWGLDVLLNPGTARDLISELERQWHGAEEQQRDAEGDQGDVVAAQPGPVSSAAGSAEPGAPE